MAQDQVTRRIAAFRAELEARGEPISDYCRRMGLDYDAMHAVLKGRSKGKRGEAHKVFVALGLKPGNPTRRKQTEQAIFS
ncbi:DNA-binding protein [Pseudomonas aeruginosa]|nr:DNA-binding protein [Pseudomonas aeruginosa]